jgi:aminopeptidase N
MHEVVCEDGAPKCELLTEKQGSFTLPGCSTWVLADAGATGYYRVGYQPETVRALAHDAESKLSAAERIGLLTDVWASVRAGTRTCR